MLDEKKVPHLYNVIPGGGHDFKVWKSDLYHFSQLLFRSGPAVPAAAQDKENPALSKNKQTVQKYMDAFGKTDHAAILSCLTDDVEWFIPGAVRITGKAAFDKEIENDAFVGSPTIKLSRMIEEKDVVVAEGSVRTTKKDGGVLNLLFCDVFEMREGKIKRLTSYLVEIKDAAPKKQ
jgi:ketosteroid isomerase-like protein